MSRPATLAVTSVCYALFLPKLTVSCETLGEFRSQEIKHRPYASTGLQFSMCDEPDLDRKRVKVWQDPLNQRFGITDIFQHKTNTQPMFDELPKDKELRCDDREVA